jgi:hypothetical protein
LALDVAGLIAVSVPAFFLAPAFAASLAAGALVLALCAVTVRARRNELIRRWAVHRDAYELPSVAAYGAKISSAENVARLAAWLREVLETCGDPLTWVPSARIRACRDEIAALADELVSPDHSLSPDGAAECQRLLTRMVESPLYNEQLPEEDLRAAIFRIRDRVSFRVASSNRK